VQNFAFKFQVVAEKTAKNVRGPLYFAALCRWTEHYSEALNHLTAVPCPELDAQQFQAVDDPEVPMDAPTLDEVRAAIKKLKFGRAAGLDAIPPEMLKLAIDPTSHILHQLFASVWTTGKVPCAWKEGMVISLYKGKGPRNECASYRPVTLLSVPGKVFAHVLFSRVDPLLRSKRRFEQSGFTSGQSTLDAILALRLLSEVHREFSQPLHVTFVDLKAAFDSVDQLALWKAL